MKFEFYFFFFVEILFATSAVRPRADVAYCIHALSRRLAKTRNWTVVTLIFVINCNLQFDFLDFLDFLLQMNVNPRVV